MKYLLIVVLAEIVLVFLIQYSIKINKLKDRKIEKEKSIKEALFQLNHEIKNPIAVVNGYLELYSNAKSNKQREKYIEIIKQEVSRTLTIINDFSELGRMKKVEKDLMDIGMLFEEIIDLLQPLFKENNSLIIYKNKDEIIINGCYERLKEVFINILKNALESKDKGFLVAEIKIKKSLKEVQISIIDNGKGMTPIELEQINKVFFSTKKNGTGVGLAYARQILDLHSGKIEFKSKEKKGTTAIVTLPIDLNSNNC